MSTDQPAKRTAPATADETQDTKMARTSPDAENDDGLSLEQLSKQLNMAGASVREAMRDLDDAFVKAERKMKKQRLLTSLALWHVEQTLMHQRLVLYFQKRAPAAKKLCLVVPKGYLLYPDMRALLKAHFRTIHTTIVDSESADVMGRADGFNDVHDLDVNFSAFPWDGRKEVVDAYIKPDVEKAGHQMEDLDVHFDMLLSEDQWKDWYSSQDEDEPVCQLSKVTHGHFAQRFVRDWLKENGNVEGLYGDFSCSVPILYTLYIEK